jgi:hypothetical protein
MGAMQLLGAQDRLQGSRATQAGILKRKIMSRFATVGHISTSPQNV